LRLRIRDRVTAKQQLSPVGALLDRNAMRLA
jgi:hypothetical protein